MPNQPAKRIKEVLNQLPLILNTNPSSQISQRGFAPILLVVLALVGITAATLLIQSRTNFLPKAADSDPYEILANTINKLADDPILKEGTIFIILPGNKQLTRYQNETRPSFSVIKLWVAAAAMDNRTYDKSNIEKMLINSDNEAANQVITDIGAGDFDDGVNNVNQYIIRAGNYPRTRLKRKLGLTYSIGQPDNETSASDSVNFLVNLMDNKITNASQIQDILKQRTPKSDFIPNPKFQGNLIGKSGILQTPYDGRNDVGVLTNSKGDRAYFAFFFPSGGNKAAEKIQELEQQIYNNIESNPQQAAPEQAARDGQATIVQDNPCTNPTHIAHCESKKNLHGTGATGKCFLLNKDPSKPKCEYTLDFKPLAGAKGPCNEDDNSACSNGCELIKATLASDKREIRYSQCKATGTAPAAAAAQQNAQRPAGAAGAPTSNTKTPWDKDADGDSKLISQVLTKAVQAIPDLKNAKDAIDGAKTAKAAYEAGFKKAYSDIFKADISKDPDALAVLNTQANYVAVHAYTSIDPAYKGKAWDPSNLKGAIDNLKTNGVIPQSADLSKITPPNAIPGSAAAPTKLTIDPNIAVDCGSDIDGTKIPCYQIGVFASYDDLKATEAQASIATQRYVKSQEILNTVKDKVNSEIWNAAQTKLNAAKDKAAACMKK